MERRMISIALIGVASAFLAVNAVIASPWMSDTPLYTYRMEQASSKMNFLPTAVNDFTYTAEQGFELDYGAAECCDGGGPLGTGKWTCIGSTCETCDLPSCEGGYTCSLTCPNTCESTCGSSCGGTCWETCPWTCNQWTCPGFTCDGPC